MSADDLEGFSYHVSTFTGAPVWTCNECGHAFTYVESADDLEHACEMAP